MFKFDLCDDECPYLRPTEKEQNEQKKRQVVPRDLWKHVCHRYNKQVFHGPVHPEIISVRGCKYSIKGARKCQKETKNVRCSGIVMSTPRQTNAPHPASSMIRRTLTKVWRFLRK